jgi:hypothetical protein
MWGKNLWYASLATLIFTVVLSVLAFTGMSLYVDYRETSQHVSQKTIAELQEGIIDQYRELRRRGYDYDKDVGWYEVR